MISIDAIAAAAGAATPGKWAVNKAGSGDGRGGIAYDEIYVYAPNCGIDDVAIAADIADPLTGEPSEANATHIANCSPETILTMCEAIRALPAALEALENSVPLRHRNEQPSFDEMREKHSRAADALRKALQPFEPNTNTSHLAPPLAGRSEGA
jgi:hypothetical protein